MGGSYILVGSCYPSRGVVSRLAVSGRHHDAPRRITQPRVFRHVCIVFISPPGVEF